MAINFVFDAYCFIIIIIIIIIIIVLSCHHWYLQAMVSGAIGGFLDVAFNFHTQAMLDDNLLG
jgi:hypothetical protein